MESLARWQTLVQAEELVGALGRDDLVVVDALRVRPHPTHMNFAEAIAVLDQIQARQSLVIHLCHEVSHGQARQLLPPHIAPSYDGLQIEL